MKTSVLKTSFPPANLLNPLPVVMVSCGNTPEEHNIITVAWCGTVCSDPPMCYISIRPERHSYTIIKKNREFVINLVSKNLTEITDWCGVRSGKKYRKFEKMMITPIAAEKIKAPMIAESPVNIECVVKEIIPLGSHDMFIADIVAIHASEKYLNPTTQALELSNANLVSYNHGHYYCLGKELGKFGFSVEKEK